MEYDYIGRTKARNNYDFFIVTIAWDYFYFIDISYFFFQDKITVIYTVRDSHRMFENTILEETIMDDETSWLL